ncbi:MAG: putative redox protein, partial [uncultured bacterium]
QSGFAGGGGDASPYKMVRIELNYLGDLKMSAKHGPSGAVIKTAAPVDNEGDGSSFSPTDLTATSLGACMSTIMGILAKRHYWDITGLKCTVDKEMIADPHRRIGKLIVDFVCDKEIPPEAQTILEKGALTCPVIHSLNPKIEVVTNFKWKS